MITGLTLRTTRFIALVLLCLMAGTAFAQSSAFERGRSAYKNQDYGTAAREFQQAVQDNPDNAKAFYDLGLSQAHLSHWPETVSAWDRAQSLDPSIGFTNDPNWFRSHYADAKRRVGGTNGTSGGRGAGAAEPNVGPLVQTLSKGDAYVEPGMGTPDLEMKLENLARSYRPLTVKIAVVNQISVGDRLSSILQQYGRSNPRRSVGAWILHNQLGQTAGTFILLTKKGYAVYSSALSGREMDQITTEARRYFPNYYDAIKSMGDQSTQEINAKKRGTQRNILLLVLAFVGGGAFVTSRMKAAAKKRVTELTRQLNERLAALQDEFKRFDLESASAKDSPLLQEAKQLRSAAVDPFAEAGEKFNLAQTVGQYEEVDRVTTQAEKLAAKAHIRLEQAEGKRPLDDPNEHGSIPRAEDVPLDDRGACFFCSKPARMQDLHSLEINADGRQQRVLACDDCYDIAKTGRQPQILAVPDDHGQRIPWYQSNRYDPWNDYGRGGIFGGGGMFGGNFGLMDYLLLENLFDHDRRSNPVVITPQDPGYGQGGGFFNQVPVDADSSGTGPGDFFGNVLGGGDNGDSSGSGPGDFFGGDSGGDSGGGDFFSGGGGNDV